MTNSQKDVAISKTLSWLLRHAAVKEGLNLASDGFISVEQLLKHRSLKGCDVDNLIHIVNTDKKNRYTIKGTGRELQIRANQGHSIEGLHDIELTPILEPNTQVIHGTFLKYWPNIKKYGLSRMNRVHLHFTTALENVKSGIRPNADVFVYVDLERALKAGLKFYRSVNGVVLSPGNEEGIIGTEFFEKVCLKDGSELEF